MRTLKLLIFFFASLTVAKSSHASTKIEVQLRWYHQFQFAGYYAAKIKGFYENAGLEVELIEGSPEINLTQFVLEKPNRYSIAATKLLVDRAQGNPVVVVSSLFQHAAEVLITLDPKIRRPSDLVGKRVMIRSGNSFNSPGFRAMVQADGASPDDVKWLTHTWKDSDLISGKVDAMSGYLSTEVTRLKKKGHSPHIFDPLDSRIDFYGDLLFTSEETIKSDPSAVRAFVHATHEGWRYAFDHPVEMIDYILELPSVKPRGLNRELLEIEATETRRLVEPDLVELGYSNEWRWSRIVEIYKKYGQLPEKFTTEGLFFLEQEKEKRTWLRNIQWVLVGIMILMVLAVLWLVQLRVQVRKKTAELKRANEVKNLFLANMSHEIRTPLTAILGFADLLRSPNLTQQRKNHYLSIIERTGRTLATILNDILDITRVEAGQLQITPVPCDLLEIMEHMESLLQLKTQERGLYLKVTAGELRTTDVIVDPIRLKQIVLNVVGNAIKFTREGGVSVHYEVNEKDIIIRVSDTGEGMTEIAQTHLFQIFSPGDETLRKEFGGAGLGLSIAKNLAGLLGGDVTLVRSAPGAGSEFEIRVGYSQAPQTSPITPLLVEDRNVGRKLSQKKIMLVDDCSDNQLLVKLFLEQEGAKVTLVNNGEDAVRTGLSEPFDLIFMDIQMPILDGEEATTQLRKAGFKTPIIALTANIATEDLARYMDIGCTDTLAKPVKKEKLIQIAEQYTKQQTNGN